MAWVDYESHGGNMTRLGLDGTVRHILRKAAEWRTVELFLAKADLPTESQTWWCALAMLGKLLRFLLF